MTRAPQTLGAALGAALLVAGCAARSSPATDAATDGRPPVVVPRGLDLAPYVDVVKTPGTCADPQGAPDEPATASEVVSLLTGRWQRCAGSLSGVTPDGLEVDRDRRWLNLVRTSTGALEPATGPDSEAIWFLGIEAQGRPAEDGEDGGPADGEVDAPAPAAPPAAVLEGLTTDLRLIYVSPTTIGHAAFTIGLFTHPTGLSLSGALDFVWLGE